MSSKKPDETTVKAPSVELLLPIRLYWEVEGFMKQLDYMLASSEDPVQIADLNQKVLSKVASYAVHEKDRAILETRRAGNLPAANQKG